MAAAIVAVLMTAFAGRVWVKMRAEEVTIDEFVDGTMKLKGSCPSRLKPMHLTDVS